MADEVRLAMTIAIDTVGLPPATAEALRDLAEDLIATHPGLTGLQLAGSFWNPSAQLPGADLDVRRFGDVDRSRGDERVAGIIILFEHRGHLVELAEWLFGDLAEPETLSLQAAISFVRARILWERGTALHDLKTKIATLLADDAWRRRKLAEAFARCRLRFSQLESANDHLASLRTPPAAMTDDSYFKHVFYTLVDELCALVSAVDLRPPSVARKAMLEIADCLDVIGLAPLTGEIYEAFGCADFTAAECRDWYEELDALYAETASVNEAGLPKRRYHLTAIASMMDSGHERAAVFPLWRGLDECRSASDFIPPPWLKFPPGTAGQTRYRELRKRIDDDLERLRIRLRFQTEAQIGDRIGAALAALTKLQRRSRRLNRHLDARAAAFIRDAHEVA